MDRFLTKLPPGGPCAQPDDRQDPPLASPFDELGPSSEARRAAGILMEELGRGWVADGVPASILHAAGAGKMFGVLVVRTREGDLGFLRAFSGMFDGRWDLPGFVPPLFDRGAREAFESEGEKVVKGLTARAEEFAASIELADARRAEEECAARHAREIVGMRLVHTARRRARQQRRRDLEAEGADAATPPGPQGSTTAMLHALDQESRGDRAERRRLDARHALERRDLVGSCAKLERRLAALERLRRMVSRHLMRRIHDTYFIANARGEGRPLRALFAGVEPPGGAGDCAAPKLLAFAFAHGMKPLALAEFWWGAPPPGGGRVSGAFYPACRDKCGPLLPWMLEGLEVASARRFATGPATEGLDIAYEDDAIVIVDKPAGLLSVPARDLVLGDSVLDRLRARHPQATGPLLVHRLDLDTSGVLVAALDAAAHGDLQAQFTRREVRKRYVAWLDGDVSGDEGVIELAIRGDPGDRPRQVVDPVDGKDAVTEWRVLERREGRTRVALFPRSGRTHQLRVHAAHPLGLCAPIVGDRLYGRGGNGGAADRLLLHAESIRFRHPKSGAFVEFERPAPF